MNPTPPPRFSTHNHPLEKVVGIVEKITYHNEQNGWSVLKLSSFTSSPTGSHITVTVHQAKAFAGATMEFWGVWTHHPKYGEQFKATQSIEKKPASIAALEKYLGSGLIKGVGPHTAKKIVSHFKDRTLEVFEGSIEELKFIPGIADKRLQQIRLSWEEHRSIRDVMIFLQKYGISTLFATKIFKTYGDKAISVVSENPYRLAQDIYGIGFFSADQIALSMGFERTGSPRIEAGIKHVLSSSRNDGHCYLTQEQIFAQACQLLDEEITSQQLTKILQSLISSQQIKQRHLPLENTQKLVDCFYSKSLYFDEWHTVQIIQSLLVRSVRVNGKRIQSWVSQFCKKNQMTLSQEQQQAICQIPGQPFAILTGGPGCGKTTCTKVLVHLLHAMRMKVTLTAPTGRAAQRMTEVIGMEAKTIHRLLEWSPNGFKKNEKNPLDTHFLILDEASMLDISLAAHLLRAIHSSTQVLFIGDPDQLPSVGAGRVLDDLLQTPKVPCFRLTQIFRQAQQSSIIQFAHEINRGKIPQITSPLRERDSQQLPDCLFLDADEPTQDQLKFIRQVRQMAQSLTYVDKEYLIKFKDEWGGKVIKSTEGLQVDTCYRPHIESEQEVRSPVLHIPNKFRHAHLPTLANSSSQIEQLMTILKSVHPWSSLRLGLTALESLLRVYTHSIKKWLKKDVEIQVLTPQVRGTLGTLNLNESLQKLCNPESSHKPQITMGRRVFRVGDRVIQTQNNYDLGVFNGDIGKIIDINHKEVACTICFPDGKKGRHQVLFKHENINEIQLAYAITIHKSQGSEFDVIIIPVLGQHFNMLFRNLIYTGLTRAKKLAVFIGNRKALAMAIRQVDNRKRQTALKWLIENSQFVGTTGIKGPPRSTTS